MPERSDDQVPAEGDVPIGIDSPGVRSEFDSLGSAMLITALSPVIGHQNAAEQFDTIVDPHSMVGNGVTGA
jgi:hypothetical protein